MYKYIPNDYGKKKFGLTEEAYIGGGLTTLFQHTLGRENLIKFMIAQNPFSNKRTKKAKIMICLNLDKVPHEFPRFRSIGIVEKY
ncbi:hypothetical protein HZB03_03245 [Candidatus Woesearchaeota archaeon]|nr:hypothetical protein [Candidatus Woesearchaeota archaeon]